MDWLGPVMSSIVAIVVAALGTVAAVMRSRDLGRVKELERENTFQQKEIMTLIKRSETCEAESKALSHRIMSLENQRMHDLLKINDLQSRMLSREKVEAEEDTK